MNDHHTTASTRNPPSQPFKDEQDAALREELNRQLAREGISPAPIYPKRPDTGDRTRRTDPRPHSHYFKDVSALKEIDIYAVCELFNVTDPSGATQHAIKKLLMSGQRGAKDARRDLQEAADTLARKLQMMEGK